MLLTVPAFGSAITKSTTTTTARMIRFRRVSIVASYRAAGRHASSARPRTLLVDWFDDEEPVARLVDGSSDAFAWDDSVYAHTFAVARAYFVACVGRLRDLNRAHVRSVPPPQGVPEPHPLSETMAGRSD